MGLIAAAFIAHALRHGMSLMSPERRMKLERLLASESVQRSKGFIALATFCAAMALQLLVIAALIRREPLLQLYFAFLPFILVPIAVLPAVSLAVALWVYKFLTSRVAQRRRS